MTTLTTRIEALKFLPTYEFDKGWERDRAIRNAREFIKRSCPTTIVGKARNLFRNTYKVSRDCAFELDYELGEIKSVVENIDAYLLKLRRLINQYLMRIYDIQEKLDKFTKPVQISEKIGKSLMLEEEQLEKAIKRIEEVCLEFETKKEKLRTAKNQMIQLLMQLEKIGNFDWYSKNWAENGENDNSV